jgi:hypothetical protein
MINELNIETMFGRFSKHMSNRYNRNITRREKNQIQSKYFGDYRLFTLVKWKKFAVVDL